MRWFLVIIMALMGISCNNDVDVNALQEGDIVFIESQSSQSPYIKVGTMSKWTHCGIVVNTPEGMKVLEASKTVRLTPFAQFIGAAKNENWCIRRPKQKISVPINYQKYLGQPYDLEFKLDNGKMYCSELVWIIYKEHGIELCKPRKVSSFAMTRLPKVKRLMDKRNIRMNQEAVAPIDIYKAI
jgi:uncharacterized protein YycO